MNVMPEPFVLCHDKFLFVDAGIVIAQDQKNLGIGFPEHLLKAPEQRQQKIIEKIVEARFDAKAMGEEVATQENHLRFVDDDLFSKFVVPLGTTVKIGGKMAKGHINRDRF